MLEILQFDFMLRAFGAGLIIALIAPLIGIFLVVRRYSLMADTLAHVSLVGVAVGLLTRTYPVFAAVLVSVLAALGIERLREEQKIFSESILALFLSGSLAVATILISLAKGFNANLFSYLFGSITTVSSTDLYFIAGIGLTVILLISLFYKELFFVSLDTNLARVSGLPARSINRFLVVLAAVTVAIAMRVVGALLVGALMVIPVITAMQWGRGFRTTLLLSLMFSLVGVFSGIVLSYYFNLATGGTIVIVALFFFFVSSLLNRRVSV